MIPLSILDLCPITEGSDAAQSFRNTLDLAQHGESWGYQRFWLAEHHGMPGIASAATAVLIAHVAGGTSRIRVGAGGIMLPNHSPLVIAEQFGTLESLFPGRIDLGLGRAPGSDQLTARALRRNLTSDADQFPQDVVELIDYLSSEPKRAGRGLLAVPGAGLNVPVWILGSSLFGAQLAAALGLPYAFASHFAPAQMMQAIQLYRATFKPSALCPRPYVMLGFNVFAADTDAQAHLLVLGTLFPYLLKISEPYVTNVGGMLGRLAAVNTAGAILGSLLAGFVLLPCLGLWKSIHGLAVLYVFLAVALAFMIKSLGRIWRVTALGAALLCSGLLLWTNLPPMLLSPGETMVEYWHGTNGTVAVVDHGNNRQLKVDGHYGLGGSAAAEIERGQTRIPLMLNPRAKSIFFLGLGTGITAGEASSSQYGLKRIVACELIPEVVTASRKHFSDFTGSLFTDPRCTVMVDDGRNYLQATRETFNIINSDLFIVYRKGAGSLYSLEHFQNVKAHLAPNGIFVLWIPLYQLTKDEFGMIARTILEVFPQVTAWRNQFITWGDAVALVGQTSESSFFAEGHHGYPLDKRRESWEQQDQNLHEFNLLLNYCGNLSRAKKLFSGYPLNTDDRPLIEYSGPISASLQAIDKVAWLAGPKFIALVNEMQACSPPEQDPALSSLPLEQRHAARAGYYLARALLFEDYYKKTHESELVWKQESQKARQQFQMLWLQKE